MNKKIIFILCLTLLLSCNNKKEETVVDQSSDLIKFSDKQIANFKLEYCDVEQIEMTQNIECNGIVDVPPDHVFTISFPVAGIISKINHNLLPGSKVKKGDLLAVVQSLELLQIQEDYLNESTKSELLMQEFERQKELLAQDATAKRKLQEAENALKLNRIRIRSLAEKLRVVDINPGNLTVTTMKANVNIYAKNSGFVKNVNVSNGKIFKPEDALFEFVNTEHMHVELKVLGENINLVKEGQKVDFNYPGSNKIANGKVYLIDKTIDPDHKMLNLHVHIEDEAFEQALRPGQYLKGKVEIASSKVSAVPESAVLSNSEGDFGYYLSKEKGEIGFKRVKLNVGSRRNGFVQVLNPGDIKGRLVSKNQSFIENAGGSEE